MENKLDELNQKVEARKSLKQAHYMQKLEDGHCSHTGHNTSRSKAEDPLQVQV
jgi:hypothetical protein